MNRLLEASGTPAVPVRAGPSINASGISRRVPSFKDASSYCGISRDVFRERV
jgi:hypothetical protein